MKKVFVKPAPGFKMRDPITLARIPADGYLTNLTPHTMRRMMTRVGGTDQCPVFELNAATEPHASAEPTKRKHSGDAEKVG